MCLFHRLADKFKLKQPIVNDENSISPEPLDGGYGWFVVFGAFSVQFWVAGLVKSYGVLFVEILEVFPNSSTAVASWIPAILSALCLALAPLSSALCQRFSCRSVVFVGGLFCALGLTLSSFAKNIYHLLFTFGILTGKFNFRFSIIDDISKLQFNRFLFFFLFSFYYPRIRNWWWLINDTRHNNCVTLF